MANNWVVDNCFPTFTGQENAKQMIQALVDYMRQLTDQLRYSLENLDSSNWNGEALKQMGAEMTSDMGDQISKLLQYVNRMSAVISMTEATVAELGRKMRNAEEAIAEAEYDLEEHEGRIEWLEQQITEREVFEQDIFTYIQELTDAMTLLTGAIQADIEGATIGGEGLKVALVGDVTINGVAQ